MSEVSSVDRDRLTYLPADLLALDHGRPPRRQVRKKLFTLHLWKPARWRRRHYRRATPGCPQPRPTNNVNTTQRRRSADRSTLIGWLNVRSLTSKTDIVSDVISERSLDVLALTETWHSDSNDVRLRLATPDGYAAVDAARQSGRGGGVAVIYRKHLRCSRVSLPALCTLEAVCVRLTTSSGPIVLLNVYRPGSTRPSTLFYDELASVLELLVVHSCPVIMGGDINIHVEDADDPDAQRFGKLLVDFDVVQHVTSATHRSGGTLDLVMTFAGCPVDEISVDPAGVISDHALVVSRLPMHVGLATTAERLVRGWRRVDRDELRRVLMDSELCRPVAHDANIDDLFDTYGTVLRQAADSLAPLHSVRRRAGRSAPWFDADCRAARRKCRQLERRWRRTRVADDRHRWVDAVRQRFQMYRAKKEAYWLDRLEQNGRSAPKLWRSLSSLLGRDRDITGVTGHSADGFASFFERKIDDVRTATAGCPLPPVGSTARCTLSTFRPCTQDEVRRIIMSSPTKSCPLDPVPTFIVRETVDVLLPFITTMVNVSLSQGRLPASQKHAIVTPLLKKAGLDATDMANFRPVSNLTFVSKVIERAVALQLNHYLNTEDLLPRNQSAYRKHHSTETALIRVMSDALMAADRQQVTLLGLLDLSAAFDCVDHTLLLQRLRHQFGLTGVVLQWMTSFVTDRTQQVAYNGQLSTVQPLQYGVPQGSVLGPLLFVMYTAELHQVVATHGLTLHQYADDCQIYLTTSVNEAPAAVERFSRCLTDVDAWLGSSRLRLNPTKTQVMWMGSKGRLQQMDIEEIPVMSSTVRVVDTARDLGVVFDSRLSMASQVAAMCRASYYQLRQLRVVTRCMTSDAAKTTVQAFITCRLDFSNALLYGITDDLLRRLQSIQNAAARLVSGTRRSDHITPVLRRLHWLPVKQRIDFKMALLVFKSLHGLTPRYLSDDCQLLSDVGRRQLRSSDVSTCVVPRTNTSLGDRAFQVAGPKLWNSLPATLRRPDMTTGQFRGLLKTYLFA